MRPAELWPFVGRRDVFAEQSEGGSYYPVKRPIGEGDLLSHLDGEWSIGTYVITPETQTVHYVVFDLDVFDQEKLFWLANCVEYAVDPLGDEGSYDCLLMEHSGGKGYHVWLFLDRPIEAWRVRRWLDERFWPRYRNGRHAHEALEVFPKQDRVSPGGYGNLVKLPFGIHAKSGARSKVVPYQNWPTRLDTLRGMNTSEIPHYADKAPEVLAAVTADTPTGILLGDGLVSRFMRGEVGQGERNMAFHAFFTWCAWNIHCPSDLAWQWWEQLNGELPDPEDDEASVLKTMESAYSRPPADAGTVRRPVATGHRTPPAATDGGYRASGSWRDRVKARSGEEATASE